MKKVTSSWEDWHKRYASFPGVPFCVELLKRRNTPGELVDTICGVLETNASDHIDALLAAAENDENDWIRIVLLGVIENSCLPAAVPFWGRVLSGGDSAGRSYAIRALKQINTRESRKILWEAGAGTASGPQASIDL